MSDTADRADARIAAAIASGINLIRNRPTLLRDGHCHFCQEQVPNTHLFCNADCRDDHQRHQDALQRAGISPSPAP